MRKVGFIGVGIMGKSMVRNLMKAGFELRIFARDRAKVADVIAEGAAFSSTIAECVKGCSEVITMVGFPKDVEEVYFGAGNVLDSAERGACLIDMTTSSPTLAERLYAEGTKRGFRVMDAPVTGGETGARDGTLSILAGGDRADYEACMPLFRAMGANVNYQGKAGCGQHAKLTNQIMIAGTLSGVCEAIAYARAKELDLEVLMKSLSTGAAASKQLDAYWPKITDNDFQPSFFLKHFLKDLTLASEEAAQSHLHLEVLAQVTEDYGELARDGFGDMGTQALIKHYER